ncbi:MAG: alaS [Phycisphaerales bacterium]|nr:alaS [Phycisphaerales bacterium]
MGEAFPELKKDPARVAEIIRDEEVSFGRTWMNGVIRFDGEALRAIGKQIANDRDWKLETTILHTSGPSPEPFFGIIGFLDKSGNKVIVNVPAEYGGFVLEQCKSSPQLGAETAFQLHDTYGFSIDLTQVMAAERGMSVDIDGYQVLMEEARAKARAGGKTGDDIIYDLPPDTLAELEANGVPRTDDSAKYAGKPTTAKIVAVWRGDELVNEVPPCVDVALMLDKTSFYAEMGGQVGDTGSLSGSDAIFDIFDTHNVGGYVLHIGRITSGTLTVGDTVTATVAGHRDRIQSNHTATHLLNLSLKKHLGDGVQQKGSLVDADKLRFDFSHGKSLAENELDAIERDVAAANNLTVYTEEVPQEKALKINGLRAVFGEKYPPIVRVVSVGVPVQDLLVDPANEKWPNYSIEFCGGTHVPSTDVIGRFAVVAEESVSKGVRRVVALTGEKAAAAWAEADRIAAIVSKADAAPDADVPAAIVQITAVLKDATLPLSAKRRVQAKVVALQARAKAAEKAAKAAGAGVSVDIAATAAALLESAIDLGGGKIVVGEVAGATDDQLRGAIDSIRKKTPSYGIMLASAGEAKVSFVAAVSDDLIARGLKSGDWVRETAKIAGGGGGGSPKMAQAGGKDPTKLAAALDRAREVAKAALGG